MNIRTQRFLLAVLVATSVRPGVMAQGVIAPAPQPVGLSATPQPAYPVVVAQPAADRPATPGPACIVLSPK